MLAFGVFQGLDDVELVCLDFKLSCLKSIILALLGCLVSLNSVVACLVGIQIDLPNQTETLIRCLSDTLIGRYLLLMDHRR